MAGDKITIGTMIWFIIYTVIHWRLVGKIRYEYVYNIIIFLRTVWRHFRFLIQNVIMKMSNFVETRQTGPPIIWCEHILCVM